MVATARFRTGRPANPVIGTPRMYGAIEAAEMAKLEKGSIVAKKRKRAIKKEDSDDVSAENEKHAFAARLAPDLLAVGKDFAYEVPWSAGRYPNPLALPARIRGKWRRSQLQGWRSAAPSMASRGWSSRTTMPLARR